MGSRGIKRFRLFYKHRIPTGCPQNRSKGLVASQLLIGNYTTLRLRVAGDWFHINAKDARILAHDRGCEKLWHVFNSLTLKLIAQDLRVRDHGPETSLGIV